jgi:hypothetical protein
MLFYFIWFRSAVVKYLVHYSIDTFVPLVYLLLNTYFSLLQILLSKPVYHILLKQQYSVKVQTSCASDIYCILKIKKGLWADTDVYYQLFIINWLIA